MKIFPIGIVTTSSSSGTIDNVTYSFFEPNLKAKSSITYNNLITKYEQQTILTRKKSEPMLSITYEYENIFAREYNQIEHFVDSVDDSLTSFRVIDLSKGRTPTAVASVGTNWVVNIDNTRLYSATTNMKADRGFLWDGKNWKEGDIVSITANASVSIGVLASNFGALTLSNAATDAVLYPSYTVYLSGNALSSFETTNFIDETISNSEDGGFMRTGQIVFLSKYKI